MRDLTFEAVIELGAEFASASAPGIGFGVGRVEDMVDIAMMLKRN